MKQFLILILLLSLNPAQAGVIKANGSRQCALTKNINVDELVDSAAIIFRGRLDSISQSESNGLPVRELHFKVSDPIKGVDSKLLTLKEWASVKSPFVEDVIENKPYVFFFHEPSKIGLTSLIGMEQGLVNIDRNNRLKYSKRLGLKKVRNYFFMKRTTELELNDYKSLRDFCSK